MKITVEVHPQELRELLSFNAFVPVVRPAAPQIQKAIPTKTIRDWARSKGLAVAKGGTLPKDVIDAYYAEEGGFH